MGLPVPVCASVPSTAVVTEQLGTGHWLCLGLHSVQCAVHLYSTVLQVVLEAGVTEYILEGLEDCTEYKVMPTAAVNFQVMSAVYV